MGTGMGGNGNTGDGKKWEWECSVGMGIGGNGNGNKKVIPAYLQSEQELTIAQIWATVPEQLKWAEKWGLLCPFPWGSWVPSNTMSPGPRPTFLVRTKLHLHQSNCLATRH